MEKSSIGKLIESIRHYLKMQREYAMLTLAEKLTVLLSAIAVGCILLILTALVLLFASFALGAALGRWLDSEAMGFGVIALLYVVLALVVYFNRCRWVVDPIANLLTNLFVDNGQSADDAKANNASTK